MDPAEVDLPPGAHPGLVFVEAPFDGKDLTSKERNDCRNLEFNFINKIVRQMFQKARPF